MERNLRKERVGLVVSDKMDKTVVVAIVDKSKHPLYKKTITKTNKVAYGEYGLVAVDGARITSRQIEAARIAMTRFIKRGGQVWIDIFPHKPITRHPAESRMGSGKGAVEYWVAIVKPGRVLFEMAGVPEDIAREAMRLAGHKLPIKTKFMVKGQANPVTGEMPEGGEKITEGGEG